MINQTSLKTMLSLQKPLIQPGRKIQTSTKYSAHINRVYPSEGLTLSFTTTICKNKLHNSWRVEGGFSKTLGDSIDHPNTSRVKNPTFGPWGLPENKPRATAFVGDYIFLIVQALQWQAPASKVIDHCQLTIPIQTTVIAK